MAQDTTTVTPPNPTPPTNMSCTGATGPNPGTFDPTIYTNAGGDLHYPRLDLAPYFDDGITRTLTVGGLNENVPASGVSASPQAIAAKTAALAVAGTSADGEGRGTENVVTTTYPPFQTNGTQPFPLKTVNCGPNATAATREAGPNATHSSTLSPVVVPALVSISPTTLAAAATGTQLITCTGTGFVPGCRVWHDNVEQTTTWVSATSITSLVKKRSHAGAVPVSVKLAGVNVGVVATFTWT